MSDLLPLLIQPNLGAFERRLKFTFHPLRAFDVIPGAIARIRQFYWFRAFDAVHSMVSRYERGDYRNRSLYFQTSTQSCPIGVG